MAAVVRRSAPKLPKLVFKLCTHLLSLLQLLLLLPELGEDGGKLSLRALSLGISRSRDAHTSS